MSPRPGETRQLALDLPPATPARDADDFLPAPSNAVALGLIDLWPAWPGGRLALVGPAGSGKSHLAGLWRRRAAAASVSLTDLATEAPPALLDRAPALLLDPVTDGRLPETALLHLLNYAVERGQTVLLVSRLAPARWPVVLPDLSSRLAAMAVAEIMAPNDALLEALIVKLLADRQLAVAPGLPAYLVRRIERSGAAAAAIVARLDAAALALKQPVGLALARALLEDRAEESPVTSGEIT